MEKVHDIPQQRKNRIRSEIMNRTEKNTGKLRIIISVTISILIFFSSSSAFSDDMFITKSTINNTITKLEEKFGASEKFRIVKGVNQAAMLWRESDGNQDAFRDFCMSQFVSKPDDINNFLKKSEKNLESIKGHFLEIYRCLNEPIQLDIGAIMPVDYLFADLNPGSHLLDDLFASKIAFAVLLNFPVYTLEEKLKDGANWKREQWAKARLSEMFIRRIPSEVLRKSETVISNAENYISNYYIQMHNILNSNGLRPFPEGLSLITHWGLRDEIKSLYNSSEPLPKQKIIVKIMERIINQDIPQIVINNPKVDWDPVNNKVYSEGKEIDSRRENDMRYQHLQNIFNIALLFDQYCPDNPSALLRNFNIAMEMPEQNVVNHLETVLSSPVAGKIAKLIEKRLGRKLEEFDIWYNGFRTTTKHTGEELDGIVGKKYPNVESFQKDLINILTRLGFTKDEAIFLCSNVVIDPSRGAGHAMGAERRGDKARLRTKFVNGKANYKTFNIAIHELGHCIQQVYSLYYVDNTILMGVPNTAFTEAFAFIFQSKDLKLLGIEEKDPKIESLKTIDTYWQTYELAGVSLVTIKLWHWLYKHPTASPAEIKQAVISISKEVWNNYFATVIGIKDSILLGVYSHMIDSGLYLPNYPIGHIIQFQIEEHLKKTGLTTEMKRMCILGLIVPDLWMKYAVGSPISSMPLIDATSKALKDIESN